MAEIEEQIEESLEEAAERDARRRYVYGAVRQYPDPVLRMKAREVTGFDHALATLAARMVHVMQKARGVGLAAPQLGVLQRVLVHQADDDGEPAVLVNPVIVSSSAGVDTMEEGCLSLDAAGVTVEVVRPVAITVEARGVVGEALRIEAEGLEARVIQHEVDHLEGVLIIDRAAPDQRRSALAKLRPQPVLGGLD